jgi:hypothetical protein
MPNAELPLSLCYQHKNLKEFSLGSLTNPDGLLPDADIWHLTIKWFSQITL